MWGALIRLRLYSIIIVTLLWATIKYATTRSSLVYCSRHTLPSTRNTWLAQNSKTILLALEIPRGATIFYMNFSQPKFEGRIQRKKKHELLLPHKEENYQKHGRLSWEVSWFPLQSVQVIGKTIRYNFLDGRHCPHDADCRTVREFNGNSDLMMTVGKQLSSGTSWRTI